MKAVSNSTIRLFFLLFISGAIFSCDKNDAGKAFGFFPESYELRLVGSHPDGDVSKTITVEPDDIINLDKIVLTRTTANSFSININVKLGSGVTSGSEYLGISISDLDETDAWKKGGKFTAFHWQQNASQSRQANVSYIIEGSERDYFYDANNLYNSGSITLDPVTGDRLKGSFSFKMSSEIDNRVLNVSGNFDANLEQDDLD